MPSNHPSDHPAPSHDRISQRARELWESRGQPAGQDDAIWLEAEESLRMEAAPSDVSTPDESGRPAASPSSASRPHRRESVDARSRGADASARQNVRRDVDDDPDI